MLLFYIILYYFYLMMHNYSCRCSDGDVLCGCSRMNDMNVCEVYKWGWLIYISSSENLLEISCPSFILQLIGYCVRLKLCMPKLCIWEVVLFVSIVLLQTVVSLTKWFEIMTRYHLQPLNFLPIETTKMSQLPEWLDLSQKIIQKTLINSASITFGPQPPKSIHQKTHIT